MDNEQTQESLRGLTVKELKEILRSKKVDFSDCVEKSDLIKRVLETKDKQEPEETDLGTVHVRKMTLAGFDCIVVGNKSLKNPRLVVVFRYFFFSGNICFAMNLDLVLLIFPLIFYLTQY